MCGWPLCDGWLAGGGGLVLTLRVLVRGLRGACMCMYVCMYVCVCVCMQVLLDNYYALKTVFKYFAATGIESDDVFNMGMLSFTELCHVCVCVCQVCVCARSACVCGMCVRLVCDDCVHVVCAGFWLVRVGV